MIRAALILLAATQAQADTCTPYPWPDAPPFDTAARTLTLLRDTAPSLATAADLTRPDLCLTTGPSEAHGSFYPDTGRIVLSDRLSPGQTSAILIHELRHLENDLRGHCPAPDLSMRENARATFAVEADAMAITALVTWTLRPHDDGTSFNAFANLPESADIARTFSDTMARTDDLYTATSKAFTAWYNSPERREDYYIASCEIYLSTNEATKLPPGKNSFDPAVLTDLCRTPVGLPYPCSEPENALRR